jgi:hypothetical protein
VTDNLLFLNDFPFLGADELQQQQQHTNQACQYNAKDPQMKTPT